MAVYKDTNKTKDGRQWYFKAYKKDIDGNNKPYKSKRYLTKKEAQEEEALFLLKRDNPLRKKFTLIAKLYFDDLKKTNKNSTAYSYENVYYNHIEPFFKNYYIENIDIKIINEWKKQLEEKKLKTVYLNKIHNVLKNIFNYAMKNLGLQFNPVTISGRFQIKNDKIIKDSDKLRYITFDEFNKYISVIDDIMWKTFFVFQYYTGMRKGETQALNWNDINFEKMEIHVTKTLNTKTTNNYEITSTKNNQNRTIKINNTLLQQLIEYKQYMSTYSDFDNKWFVFGGPRFLPSTTIDRYKDRYFKESGVRRITIHEFRHSHVSLLINEYIKSSKEKNMKIDTSKFFLMMSNRMGHTIDVMQKTYMHLFPTIQDEIIDLLDNL